MPDLPALGRTALGYSPILDRQRQVVATRLTVFPDATEALDPATLFAAVQAVWPAPPPDAPLKLSLRALDGPASPPVVGGAAVFGGAAPAAIGGAAHPVALNIAGEALLEAVLASDVPPHVMLEVPAFMAADRRHARALSALAGDGRVLLLKGRAGTAIGADVLGGFGHMLVDPADAAAPSPAGGRGVVVTGARTSADVDAAIARGAAAVVGWPFDDPEPRGGGRQAVPPDVKVVLDLVQGVDREEPVARLEAVLKRDPTLAFKLIRYLNSAAFGLTVEVKSFGHALMLLGYQRLKRWLALLLASSAKGPAAKHLMFAALRRGLVLEELGRAHLDATMRGELFICGVFSLLDQLLQQPFAELLRNVPVPDSVHQALGGEGGPYQPYLELLRAIEDESVFDIRACSETLLLAPAEVNRAVLAALAAARQIDA